MSGPLFERLPDAVARLSADLAVELQNPASEARFGAAIGEPCHRAFFGSDQPCRGCLAASVVGQRRVERWYLTAGGEPGRPGTSYFEVVGMPLEGPDGRVVGMLEVLRDVTTGMGVEYLLLGDAERLAEDLERVRAERQQVEARAAEFAERLRELNEAQAQALHTERLASLGALAAGMAHEVHTPLGTILSSLELLAVRVGRAQQLLGDLDAAGVRHPQLERLREELPALRALLDLHDLAARRIQRLIRSLRQFAHIDRPEREAVDLHEGIEAALALLAHELHGGIAVVRDFAPLPAVTCRPDAVNQVLMNLLVNALQALGGRGTVTVRTRALGADQVEVAVEDDGCGIAPEVLPRIFEAGFTTKPRGVGTGLGLAIAARIVAEHGGTIEATSTLGEGTSVAFRLPVGGTPSAP